MSCSNVVDVNYGNVTTGRLAQNIRISIKSEIDIGKFTFYDSCHSIKESSFSPANVSNMPVFVTYLALQLEDWDYVFPEAEEYEESNRSTVVNLFARRADRDISIRDAASVAHISRTRDGSL